MAFEGSAFEVGSYVRRRLGALALEQAQDYARTVFGGLDRFRDHAFADDRYGEIERIAFRFEERIVECVSACEYVRILELFFVRIDRLRERRRGDVTGRIGALG